MFESFRRPLGRPWLRLLIAPLVVLLVVQLPSSVAAGQPDSEMLDAHYDNITERLRNTGSVVASVEFAVASGGSVEASRALLIASLPSTVDVLAATSAVPSVAVRVTSAEDLVPLVENPLVLTIALPPEANFLARPAQSANLSVARPVVGADQMHQIGVTGQGQTIALVDSGVEASHPDLASSIRFERCEIRIGTEVCPNGTSLQTGPGAAADTDGHGTNIAGVLTGDGGIAPRGIAPDVQLDVFKVGGPSSVAFDDTLLALDYILMNRPDVQIINFSIASSQVFTGPCPRSVWPAFFDVVTALRDRGTILVAASGNQAQSGASGFPACLEPVVSVASSSTRESIQQASNIDNATDIAAPGQDITTTALGQSAASVTGTSFAAPIVAACAALVMQDDGVSAVQAMQRLRSGVLRTARDGFSAPWINCAPRCAGRVATVNLELSQQPTSGNDVILGTRGNDEIIAGRGDDVICSFDGDDSIVAGFGDDLVLAGKGTDVVFGGDGDDQINGQLGADTLRGGAGNDGLYGSWGHDTIFGGPGDDLISGKAGRDSLYGDEGDDRILAGQGSDIASGGPGNDWLRLGAGGDQARGDGGDDQLFGGGGWDVLDGGPGTDECAGGFGVDQALACEATSAVP